MRLVELHLLHGGRIIERGSVQESAALYVLQKQKIIDILKVIVSVQGASGGDKTELRKNFQLFMDEVTPELKESREKREEAMHAILEEESQKVYMAKADRSMPTLSRRPRKSNKWRRR